MGRHKLLLYHLVAFVTVVVWGSTFVFTKLLLLSGLSSAHIFTLRFAVAYVLLLAFSLTRKSHRWLSLSWRDELLMLALGVTGGSLYFIAENEALRYTTTTNVSLIVCSCPLVAAILISLFYRSQRLGSLQMAGSLLAALGVAVVVLNGRFVLHLSPAGDALALVANVCWAVYSLLMIPAQQPRPSAYGSTRQQHYDAVFITRKVFFYGLLTMIPYYIIADDPLSLRPLLDVHVLANLLFLGCIASMACFLAWTWVMDKLGTLTVTNYVYVNPVSTIFFAWWVLSEPITPFFLIGTVLILAGMYLADRKR